jgi:hypothetical protein
MHQIEQNLEAYWITLVDFADFRTFAQARIHIFALVAQGSEPSIMVDAGTMLI